MLTLKTIASLPPGSILWDHGKGAVTGFGARRQKGETVTYVLKYRTAAGRQRGHTIAPPGPPPCRRSGTTSGPRGAPETPAWPRSPTRRLLVEVASGPAPAGQKQGD